MRNLLTWMAFLVLMATGAAAQSSYSIRSGDVLQIEVIEDSSLNRSVLVLPDGTINFPMAGTVRAAGRSIDDVRGALTAALASNFANPPTVYVTVGQLAEAPVGTGTGKGRGVAIYAMGEVNNPGKIDADRNVTLLQALAEAGGFTKFAATKRIELRRTDSKTGQEQVYIFNYKGGGISGSTRLQAGDVIVVPERRLFE